MSDQQFKVGDWIRPADDMYDSLWKQTRWAKRITQILSNGLILFDGSYSIRNGPFEPKECRIATYEERERAIAIEVAHRTLEEAEKNFELAKEHFQELTTTVCPTCGHRA